MALLLAALAIVFTGALSAYASESRDLNIEFLSRGETVARPAASSAERAGPYSKPINTKSPLRNVPC